MSSVRRRAAGGNTAAGRTAAAAGRAATAAAGRAATATAGRAAAVGRFPTLGQAVSRSSFVPEDRTRADGRPVFVGAGTDVNVAQGAFNSKQSITITQEVANALNALSRVPGQESPVRGLVFEADADAKIFINPSPANANAFTFIPGSQAQLQSKSPYGLVKVRLPIAPVKLGSQKTANDRGNFVNVGGPKFVQFISSALAGHTQVDDAQLQRLLLQGFIYGLAEPMSQLGLTPDNRGRFGNFQNFDASAVTRYYNENLKNPDQVRLGRFASASAVRNFANTGAIVDRSGRPMDAAQVLEAYSNNNGSVRGQFGWAEDYKKSANRSGITTHPLRDADGEALRGPVTRRDAGQCNVYGSGPGMGGNGNDEYQLRLYKAARNHRSTSAKVPYGQSSKNGQPTYFCAPTAADVIDTSRKVYRQGGARAGNAPLGAALDVIADELGNGLDSTDLANRYQEWSTQGIRQQVPAQFVTPANNPKRPGKGGFGRFTSGFTPAQAKAISVQFDRERANAALPVQYQGK